MGNIVYKNPRSSSTFVSIIHKALLMCNVLKLGMKNKTKIIPDEITLEREFFTHRH